MKRIKFLSVILLLTTIMSACSSSDDSEDEGEGQLPMVFTVSPFLYKNYDVPQTNSNFQGSGSYALAVFTEQPTATKYTARYYDSNFPNLHFEISWFPGEEIPAPGFMDESVPGYNKGIIGGQYHIAAVKNGCQSSISSGVCAIGGANTQANEQGLRDIGGKMEITIEFQ